METTEILNSLKSKRFSWISSFKDVEFDTFQKSRDARIFIPSNPRELEYITLLHIKEILTSIWITKTETASRIRMRIEAVLDYAAVIENTDRRNPARWKGNLDKLFPAPRKIAKRVNFASAPNVEVPRIMAELRKKNSLSAYCLRFTILTAARSMEARSAFWREIDLENKVWKIPASRMKAEREYAVPLCDEAIEILKKMREFQPENAELVFQGERGGVLSDVTINKTLRSIASGYTVHGFRSSFRVWGAEMTSIPSAALELALALVNTNKTESAYQRSDLFERRRELMTSWGIFCCGGSNVYQINKQKTA
jgi:integrase